MIKNTKNQLHFHNANFTTDLDSTRTDTEIANVAKKHIEVLASICLLDYKVTITKKIINPQEEQKSSSDIFEKLMSSVTQFSEVVNQIERKETQHLLNLKF